MYNETASDTTPSEPVAQDKVAGGSAPAPTERPAPLVVEAANIPQELKDYQHWVLWRYVWRGGKWTKPPYQPNGNMASSTNSKTWSSFDAVWQAYQTGKFDGIGVALTGKVDADGLTLAGVDIDKIAGDQGRTKRATDIVAAIGSYAEISPSGTGVRILLRAKPCKSVAHDGLEFYADKGRYLTVTGKVVRGRTEFIDAPEAFEQMLAKHTHKEPSAVAGQPNDTGEAIDNSDLSGGMDTKPWDTLSPADKDKYLAEMLEVPVVVARSLGEARDPWFKIVGACAKSGAPNAKEICRTYSKRGKTYNEKAFEEAYDWWARNARDISIGTLIDAAKKGRWTPPWHNSTTSSGVFEDGAELGGGAAQDNESDEGETAQGGATSNDSDEGGVEDEDKLKATDDKDEKAARDWALERILVDGYSTASVQKGLEKKWPHLAASAAEIVTEVLPIAIKWRPGVARKVAGLQKRIMSHALMNQQYALLQPPGQAQCIVQIKDALFMPRGEFNTRVDDAVIVTAVKDLSPKTTQASKAWIEDARRRVMTAVKFTSQAVGPNDLNLWTGFGVTPKAGNCALIYQHIREVICAGRDLENEALLNLLAWQAQNIGRASRIITVLWSREQQIGKGILLEKIMQQMYGPLHGAFTSDASKVFGRFNDVIRGKAYSAFDEACFAGDRKVADQIKSVAGTSTSLVEGKGIPVVNCPIAVNIFMATNHEHVAHIEEHDARYWILKVSPRRFGDVAYWDALLKEIENGGVEAFLHDMLTRDVSNFVPLRDVPRDNEEHRANKIASNPAAPELWLKDCLDNDQWLGSDKLAGWYTADGDKHHGLGALQMYDDLGNCTAKMRGAFLNQSYREWATKQGRNAQPVTTGTFWKKLSDLGFAENRGNIGRWRDVPARDALNKAIEGLLEA